MNAVVASHNPETSEANKLTREQFEALLPEEFHSKLISFEPDADFPSSFKAVVRARCTDMETCIAWKDSFSRNCGIKFIAANSKQDLERRVCSKKYLCANSNKNKTIRADKPSKSKATRPKCTGCRAQIQLSVKNVSKNILRKDKYVRKNNGALDTVINIHWCHNHSIDEGLVRAPDSETRRAFDNYFAAGIYGCRAIKHHRAVLEAREDYREEMLKDRRINPPARTVRHWSTTYRKTHLGAEWKSSKNGGVNKRERKRKKTSPRAGSARPKVKNKKAKSCSTNVAETPPTSSSNVLVAAETIPRSASHDEWNNITSYGAPTQSTNRPISHDGKGGISTNDHDSWNPQGMITDHQLWSSGSGGSQLQGLANLAVQHHQSLNFEEQQQPQVFYAVYL